MTKKDIKKITEIAEKLNWSITISGKEFTFQQHSPAGQDFSFEITAEDIEEVDKKIHERFEAYDCSEEAYLWLDHTGHGTNGAPFDMKDVYEDMEKCEKMLEELSNEISKITE